MLHQRVDNTLGTNRSRTLNRHLLLVLPRNVPFLHHYNSTVFPFALVSDVEIVGWMFRNCKVLRNCECVNRTITQIGSSLNIIDLHSRVL